MIELFDHGAEKRFVPMLQAARSLLILALACATGSAVADGAPYLREHWRAPAEAGPISNAVPMEVTAIGGGYLIGARSVQSFSGEVGFQLRTDLALNVIGEATPSYSVRDCVPSMYWEPDWLPDETPWPNVLCRNVATDAFGTRFHVDGDTDQYVAFAADGARHAHALDFDALPWTPISTADAAGGALFAVPSEDGRLHLLSVDAKNQLRWQHDIGAFTGDDVVQLAQQGEDIVLLLQRDQDLSVSRVERSQGTLTNTTHQTLGSDQLLRGASVDAIGNVYALFRNAGMDGGENHALLRIDLQGQRTLEVALSCGEGDLQLPTNCALQSRDAQTHWLSFVEGEVHLYRATAGGPPTDVWGGAYSGVSSAAIGEDGTSVVVPFGPEGDPLLNPEYRLVRVGAEPGDVRELIALPHAPPLTSNPRFDVQGGVIERLVQNDSSTIIRRFDGDGQLLWRRALDSERIDAEASDTQVCTAGWHDPIGNSSGSTITCLALVDGATTVEAEITGGIRFDGELLAAHRAGRALALVAEGSWMKPSRLVELRSGVPARQLMDGLKSPIALLDAEDQLIVIDAGTSPVRMDRFDAEGNNLATVSLPGDVATLHRAKLDASGRLWITYSSSGSTDARLARINASGQFATTIRPKVRGGISAIVATSTVTYVQFNRAPISYLDPTIGSAIVAIGANGEQLWEYASDSALPLSGTTFLHTDAHGIRLLELNAPVVTQWRLIELNPSNGQIRSSWSLPWASTDARVPAALSMQDPARIRFAGAAAGQLLVGEVGLAPAASIADAAPALTGAWVMPGLGGQGLVFEHNTGAGVLSAAWYSHDDSTGWHGYAYSSLHWHTLSGTVAASDAGEQTLVIYESRNGAFDTAPVTAPIVVGEARIHMIDCDTVTLSYHFDDQSVPDQTVALQRASPRTGTCSLRIPGASGSTLTPPAYTPASDLGGVWFEPRTSGQGVHVAIYPPYGELETETVGLGWFTYDPEGRADEPSQQHWFTASGRFDTVEQQRASLTIYRTTGGDRAYTATRNTHRVGEATLERIDCDSATLSYRFDNTIVANTFASRTRSIPLQRLGGCRP